MLLSRSSGFSQASNSTSFISGGDLGVPALLADERDQPLRIGEPVVEERDDRALRSCLERCHIGTAAQRLEHDCRKQVLHLIGQG